MTNDQFLLFPMLSYGYKNTMGAVACLFFSDPPLTPHANKNMEKLIRIWKGWDRGNKCERRGLWDGGGLRAYDQRGLHAHEQRRLLRCGNATPGLLHPLLRQANLRA